MRLVLDSDDETPSSMLERIVGDAATGVDWVQRDEDIAKERFEREAREVAKAAEEQRAYLVERGCPVKELERVISGRLDETKAVGFARAALEAGDTILVLSGARGCGKTTAATWWLEQPRALPGYVKTRPALFVDATQLARWERYKDEPMREIERAKALVIDDLGIEYDDVKGAFRSFVDGLINSRYAACLPTCITTNLPVDEFRLRYGERVADRIREVGRYVELSGESLRGRR